MFDILGSRLNFFTKRANAYYTRNSLPTVLITVGLMGKQMFKPECHRKGINNIASCTFGIYLYHFSIVDYIFQQYYPISGYLNIWYLTIMYITFFTFLFLLSGYIIETARKKIEKIYQPLILKIVDVAKHYLYKLSEALNAPD